MTGAQWWPRSRWLERRHAEGEDADVPGVDATSDVLHARGGGERHAGVEDAAGLEGIDRGLGRDVLGVRLDVVLGVHVSPLLAVELDGIGPDDVVWSRSGWSR